MSRVFDRFMVDVKASSNAKVKRLKRAGKEVRWAWFHGVLPIAATAPMRGSFCVGSVAADEHDVAAVADVTVAEARKALQAARHLGMLDRDEDGVEWVHDFEVYNPEPKTDTTAADRAKRYRERQRAKRDGAPVTDRDVTDASRRDDRDANGNVTPPEVEGEVEESSLRSDNARTARSSSGKGIIVPKDEPIGFSEWIGYHAERSGRTVPRAATSHRSQLARTFAALLAEGFTLDDFKLASDGVLADQWKRDNGHDKFETVLRKTKFGELVEDGRRARTPHLRPVPNAGVTQNWKNLGVEDGAA